MDIIYLGGSSFKIKTRGISVVVKNDLIEFNEEKTERKKNISGAGEYEVMGVSVIGIATDSSVIYVFETEKLRLCYLAEAEKSLKDSQIEEIGEVDILLTANETSEIVSAIEPHFVIPMHEKTGDSSTEILPKFSIKKEDILEDQSTKVVFLEKK